MSLGPDEDEGEASPVGGTDAEYEEVPVIDDDGKEYAEPEERYMKAIMAHYRKIEAKRHPNPNYLARQTDITPRVRETIVDWLNELAMKFRLNRETYFLTIHIMDRFLEKRLVKREKMQLIGITAMLIACKYEEMWVPQIKDLVAQCDRSLGITKEAVIALETIMLQQLKFNLTVPSPLRFAERFLALAEATPQQRYLALFFIEMTYMDTKFLRYLPSKLGAGAVYLALYATKAPKHLWATAVQPEAHYSEADLAHLIREIWAYVTTPNKYGLCGIRNKWATERYLSVSVLVPLNNKDSSKDDSKNSSSSSSSSTAASRSSSAAAPRG